MGGGVYVSQRDYLEHFGVKGMKWGVRKDRNPGPDRDERKKSSHA